MIVDTNNQSCNIICRSDSTMMMDVEHYKINESIEFQSTDQEVAILLFSGELHIEVDGATYYLKRTSCFDESTQALHVSCEKEISIHAQCESEFLVQKIGNITLFETKVLNHSNTKQVTLGGENEHFQTCKRVCNTLIDIELAPYSNMVLGEIYNAAGSWSSYPPHHHPQPEVYFYKFDKEQGFGGCFIGDQVVKISHNSAALIEGHNTHPQCSAPGYKMYYAWMIPHQPKKWENTRIFDEEHTWMLRGE